MTRLPTYEVSPAFLDGLFNAREVWARISDGRLTSEVIADTVAPSRQWPGGRSFILKHRDTQGYHEATTHQIIDRHGEIVHWDAKDLRHEGYCYYRL